MRYPSLCAAEPNQLSRPRVALVLEGGGALGFAHVGVIKVLDEYRIPVDFVTGTSMGSIVGAAFASGCTVEELERVLTTTDWDALFNETPPREMVGYRQKAGRAGELFGDAKLGLEGGDFVLPLAFVEGQYIEPLFQKLFGRASPSGSFDNLAIPYRAVAADIETGEAIVLDRGNLALAARASMSVPGFFSPVEIDGRLLVDGGITDNFPVDVARERNPEYIIGVQFAAQFRKRDELKNPLAISGQILDLLLVRTSANGHSLMREQDILISPDVSKYSSTSFKSAKEIMLEGEKAARAALPRLRTLAVSQDEFNRYYARRTGGRAFAPVIDYIRIESSAPYREGAVRKALTFKEGDVFNADVIQKDLRTLYESGDLRKLSYDVETREGKHGLVIKAEEKAWLNRYLRMGVSVQDDFSGASSYSLAVDARFNHLHPSGTYADLQLEVGESPRVFGELYQPLGFAAPVFISPSLQYARQNLTLREDGDDIARYQRESAIFGLDLGYSFGRYGELTSGWRRGPGKLKRDIGEPALPEFDYDSGEIVSSLRIDQADNADFPTRGYAIGITNTVAREELGASSEFEQVRGSFMVPLTYDATTLLLGVEVGFSSDELPVERSYAIGGAFDVSGYPRNSLAADNYSIARAKLYRRFVKGSSSLLNFGGYYGATFEFAGTQTQLATGDQRDIIAGSVFIGFDTPLVPVYLGFGMANTSEQTLFLNIGRIAPRQR
jgi:NTE family protein